MRKVKAMPPPMMILSTLSHLVRIGVRFRGKGRGRFRGRVGVGVAHIFLMSRILSETLAPPRMASTGLAGASSTLEKASSSLATRNPLAWLGVGVGVRWGLG